MGGWGSEIQHGVDTGMHLHVLKRQVSLRSWPCQTSDLSCFRSTTLHKSIRIEQSAFTFEVLICLCDWEIRLRILAYSSLPPGTFPSLFPHLVPWRLALPIPRGFR